MLWDWLNKCTLRSIITDLGISYREDDDLNKANRTKLSGLDLVSKVKENVQKSTK